MFHDLLLALSGTLGGIFKENDNKEIQVVKELPFIHPSEEEVLNRICKLGGSYRKFTNFIKDYSINLKAVFQVLKQDQPAGIQGSYLQAFCIGLDRALDPYRKTLIEIEKKVVADEHLPFTAVFCPLEEYFFTFPTLSMILDTIETRKIHGCQILQLLQENSNCGIPPVKDCLERILYTCHGVLYKQLSAWMLHGILLDQYDEFFVCDKLKDTGKGDQAKDQVDTATELDQAENEDDDGLMTNVFLKGFSGRELSEDKLLEARLAKLQLEAYRFTILPNMLPSYIPSRVADKILFVGQSVHMLKDTESLKNFHYYGKATNVLQGKENEFQQALGNLQGRKQFSIPALETEIDKIKVSVAEQLWTLVVEDGDMIRHLRLLKETFLLGRGELFLTFIDSTQTMMKGPGSTQISYDINAAFKQSLAKLMSYSEEYESLFNVSLNLEQAKKTGEEKPRNCWDKLVLNYNPPWPLHLLFTPTVMEKYQTLFSFLLKVRRTQLELQSVWNVQMTYKRNVMRDHREAITGATWSLRRQMSFVIDNLQYYLQVDVLESQFAELIEKINSTHDFESIHMAHDFFLISMLLQSFVSSKTEVFSILNRVLDTCQAFSELVTTTADSRETLDPDQVERLSQDFNRQTELLFRILTNVRSQKTSPHLAQLLLRIDFNKYFTQATALQPISAPT